MKPVERTVILGVPLARLGMRQTLDWIDQAVATGAPHQVATANVNFLALGRRDPGFLRLLQDASLVICDGMPLRWASQLLGGGALPERVPGADLVPLLAELAGRRGYRLFLMGSPGSTEEAARRLARRHPRLEIAGVESPPYGPIESWDNAAYCARIRQSRADVVLVGFGAPKQERWIARYLGETGAAVGIGVGASFDYIAGRVRRAPRPLQALGLEWAWRICVEPRRLWRRYVSDAAVVGPRLAAQLLAVRGAARRARREPSGRVRLRQAGPGGRLFVLSLAGSFPARRLSLLRRAARGVRGTPIGLVVDLDGAGFLAPTVLGELVALVGWVRTTGGAAALVASRAAARQLEAAGLGSLAPSYSSVTEAVGQLVGQERPAVFAA